ncbi:MAG TPA: hypothetical protein PLJ21_12135, partial [Pseudobdellovibrionaceae bacterium]|nr:hypothetical protein [Pseudobdellovibrionaceae bacterium]
VHEIWRHRLNELSVEQTVLIHHMMTGPEFSDWMAQMDTSNINEYHFFVDYDFHDQNYNGLTLIEKFKLTERAVLVTAHHADIDVQTLAKKISVPILSKASLATIPILIQ